MKVRVRVHAGSRALKLEPRGEELHVWVRARPVDGEANLAVIKALAENYGVPKSSVRLTSGPASKSKTFEIDGL